MKRRAKSYLQQLVSAPGAGLPRLTLRGGPAAYRAGESVVPPVVQDGAGLVATLQDAREERRSASAQGAAAMTGGEHRVQRPAGRATPDGVGSSQVEVKDTRATATGASGLRVQARAYKPEKRVEERVAPLSRTAARGEASLLQADGLTVASSAMRASTDVVEQRVEVKEEAAERQEAGMAALQQPRRTADEPGFIHERELRGRGETGSGGMGSGGDRNTQEPRVRIGTVEIRSGPVAAPVVPAGTSERAWQAGRTGSGTAGVAPLARSFAWSFGLVQG